MGGVKTLALQEVVGKRSGVSRVWKSLAHLDPPVEAREKVNNDAGLPCRRRRRLRNSVCAERVR